MDDLTIPSGSNPVDHYLSLIRKGWSFSRDRPEEFPVDISNPEYYVNADGSWTPKNQAAMPGKVATQPRFSNWGDVDWDKLLGQ